jgi:hypothetical protein
MLSRLIWVNRFFAAALLVGASSDEGCRGETPRKLDDVYRVWKQRETKIRGASFSWKQTARTTWHPFDELRPRKKDSDAAALSRVN